MVAIKVPGGFRIKSESTGKLYPKVYKSREEAEKRIAQMESYRKTPRHSHSVAPALRA